MVASSTIINELIAYGTCQAFFLAVVLLRTKKRTLFKNLFSALLGIEGIILLERLLVETHFIDSIPHVLGIAYPISFLKPPLLFFMALSITDKNSGLSKRNWWHMLPFLLIFMMNLPFYFLEGKEKLGLVLSFMHKIPSYTSFEFYFTLSFFGYIGIYVLLSLKKLKSFREQITNNVLVNWYRFILIGYTIFLAVHLAYFLIQPLIGFDFALINQISMLAMTFIIQAIAFRLIDHSNLLDVKTPAIKNVAQRKKDERRIMEVLEQDKIYLDEELSLLQLASDIDLPEKYVSELINQRFGCSFKKLIKTYRLREAKKLLDQSDSTKIKLIDVAYRSGFSNKVSFYRAFKEAENMSPSEYLQKMAKK